MRTSREKPETTNEQPKVQDFGFAPEHCCAHEVQTTNDKKPVRGAASNEPAKES